ncbi:MAG: SPASM domain-containing protein [Spirochaetes bacterium]|nr:SPASM domain-containing protein [Spirochaetota bacterium]
MKLALLIKKFPRQSLFALSVLSKGDVCLWGYRILRTFNDELSMGNIKDLKLKEILKSKKFKKLIKKFF